MCRVTSNCVNLICYSCSSCDMKICIKCLSRHECIDESKANHDERYSYFRPWCHVHQTHAKLTCMDCNNKFVCIYCVHREHKHHKKMTIKTYAPNIKNWIKSNKTETECLTFSHMGTYKEKLQKFKFTRNSEDKLNGIVLLTLSFEENCIFFVSISFNFDYCALCPE